MNAHVSHQLVEDLKWFLDISVLSKFGEEELNVHMEIGLPSIL